MADNHEEADRSSSSGFGKGGGSEIAAAGATEAIVAAAGTAGVAVSATVAEIAGTVLATAAIGSVEAITVDVVVAQAGRNLLGDQKGIDLHEVTESGLAGGALGGAFGVHCVEREPSGRLDFLRFQRRGSAWPSMMNGSPGAQTPSGPAGRPRVPEDHFLLEHELTDLNYLREHPGAIYQEEHRIANKTYI
ncbi:hypothetical protein [Streptomyces chrestomyceticus]|uniref:hypothetical protein n=1 Tax=Streptomyces chrestomyceticus TaxID=68185 RepID=UPI0033D0054C